MKEIRDDQGRKKCSQCGNWKFPDDYWKTSKVKSGLQSWCKICKKERDSNPKYALARKAYLKKYHSKPGVMKHSQELRRLRNQKTRDLIIDKYGGVCNRCGFSDKRALQIDHVLGGGTKELKIFETRRDAYHKKVLEDTSGCYQLLCANCNWIKIYENNERDIFDGIVSPLVKTDRERVFELVECICGCGGFVESPDKQGRVRSYCHGHNPAGVETRFKKGEHVSPLTEFKKK